MVDDVDDGIKMSPPQSRGVDPVVITVAVNACVVGVVESSQPAKCTTITGAADPYQQEECDARCSREASAEIRRRVAPRPPLTASPFTN